ncbi:general odorant-binding protein 69a [Drosophila mojavensis]|uniref:Odorant-binding protein 69a n=1 Tax=Drosophila mojavensis TaxID=7230 RepID=B4L070_DROMO|nr:general odorant-binding protein 69a [Drosophila mojavensis]EDW18016.1 Odorant-binding protein 69a [Drosophila mojavensis]
MYSKTLSVTLALLVLCCEITPHQAFDVPEVVKKHVKKLHKRCVAKTGVSEELLEHAQKGNLPNDPTFKCFLHCMFDMFGLIDSDNVMHLEALVEVLPVEIHDKILALVDACGKKKGVDGCDTAYQSVECYMATDAPFMLSGITEILG